MQTVSAAEHRLAAGSTQSHTPPNSNTAFAQINNENNALPPEGKLSKSEILVGPFDLHRKYRSMEGPYVAQSFNIGDLMASGKVTIPESKVVFIEGNPDAKVSMYATSSNGQDGQVCTLSGKRKELWWFKGIKLQVLDEHNRPLPTAEFVCHLNVDVDTAQRQNEFPEMERNHSSRIVTLTQGQTEFSLPNGTAVPVASDEKWTFTFQAANRTTTAHRRIKQVCTVTFIKDSDLVYPVKALNWYAPYVTVAVDRNTEAAAAKEHTMNPNCLATMAGVTAPNSATGSVITDSLGRRVSGHWVVPPGTHTYASPILEERDPGFAATDKRIHAVWTHVHPLCTEVSLGECGATAGSKILKVGVKTKTTNGLEIERIDGVISRDGIKLPANRRYQVQAKYNNTTNAPQDSMVVLGIFYRDDQFARPDWVLSKNNEHYCGVTTSSAAHAPAVDNKPGGAKLAEQRASDNKLANAKFGEHNAPDTVVNAKTAAQKLAEIRLASAKLAEQKSADGKIGNASSVEQKSLPKKSVTSYSPEYPLFDPAKDGPQLNESKKVEIETSAGNLHIVLEPNLAPKHATQLFRLLTKGAFNGTPIFRYEPNFVLQIANAETKADTSKVLPKQQHDLLRRLPLEVQPQNKGTLNHEKFVLSMGRYDGAEDSAVSSFSIMLGNAPHLDKKYTIFGHLEADAQTTKTLSTITQQWNQKHPIIIGARQI